MGLAGEAGDLPARAGGRDHAIAGGPPEQALGLAQGGGRLRGVPRLGGGSEAMSKAGEIAQPVRVYRIDLDCSDDG